MEKAVGWAWGWTGWADEQDGRDDMNTGIGMSME